MQRDKCHSLRMHCPVVASMPRVCRCSSCGFLHSQNALVHGWQPFYIYFCWIALQPCQERALLRCDRRFSPSSSLRLLRGSGRPFDAEQIDWMHDATYEMHLGLMRFWIPLQTWTSSAIGKAWRRRIGEPGVQPCFFGTLAGWSVICG